MRKKRVSRGLLGNKMGIFSLAHYNHMVENVITRLDN